MESNSLRRALTLTHALKTAVAQGDWVKAAALGDERSALLMSLQPGQPEEALAMIREIQQIDRAVTEQIKAGKENLEEHHNRAIRRLESVSKYHSTAML
ncbi:flagellar protein FliT [Paraburkholderia sp. GAS448]|uniref:flagellar protein FliT n=1 Tax=Paraburkholderia sp. GAS448 TaxID=3035136 RepID=UPI003D1B411D